MAFSSETTSTAGTVGFGVLELWLALCCYKMWSEKIAFGVGTARSADNGQQWLPCFRKQCNARVRVHRYRVSDLVKHSPVRVQNTLQNTFFLRECARQPLALCTEQNHVDRLPFLHSRPQKWFSSNSSQSLILFV